MGESETPDGTAKASDGKSAAATLIALIALIVSITSAYNSCSSSRDVAKSQLIRESYSTFENLTHLQLENWQLSHMFALSDRYNEVSRQVTRSTGPLAPERQAELLLKERAIADVIFNTFEQSFYLWNHAKRVGDIERAGFLEEVLSYLTERLLRNPRLLHYWSESGGNLAASYEEGTRKYYNTRVLLNPRKPLERNADPIGPFGTLELSDKSKSQVEKKE